MFSKKHAGKILMAAAVMSSAGGAITSDASAKKISQTELMSQLREFLTFSITRRYVAATANQFTARDILWAPIVFPGVVMFEISATAFLLLNKLFEIASDATAYVSEYGLKNGIWRQFASQDSIDRWDIQCELNEKFKISYSKTGEFTIKNASTGEVPEFKIIDETAATSTSEPKIGVTNKINQKSVYVKESKDSKDLEPDEFEFRLKVGTGNFLDIEHIEVVNKKTNKVVCKLKNSFLLNSGKCLSILNESFIKDKDLRILEFEKIENKDFQIFYLITVNL